MKQIILSIKFLFILYFSQVYAEIFEVDNDKIAKLIKSDVPIIDIRTEREWKSTGIIPQSKMLTFFDEEGNFDTKKWMDQLKKIAKENEPLIIICRSGRRSLIVANYLNSEAGYTTIYHATKGILSWKADQKETIIPK